MYIPWKLRPKQSLKVRLTIFISFFFQTLPSHPSSKRLELGERPSPHFHLLLKVSFVWSVFVIGVSWPKGDLKQWRIAAEKSKHNKIKISQKLTYLFDIGTDLKYRKRIWKTETTETTHLFFPATSWKWHSSKRHITAYSVIYLLSDDPEMSVTTDIYIFNNLSSVFLFIYLIYLSIYLIHLFIIFRRPPSAFRRSPVSLFYRHLADSLVCFVMISILVVTANNRCLSFVCQELMRRCTL